MIIYVDLGPTNVDANGHVIVENDDVNLAYFDHLSLASSLAPLLGNLYVDIDLKPNLKRLQC